MKKVIKPLKQPTKKRSKQRTQTTETAKLKIAIGKISTQLVKDHPKLIKGGGSLGITELLFSKILIKGGKLSLKTRGYIIEFLKDIAPQVNKLKQELITKLLEHLAKKESTVIDDKIYINIIYINNELMKGLYDYDIKDDIQDQIGALSEEIKEYIAILDIVKKYYILSRVKDDKTEASIMKQINENKFEELPENILEALNDGNKVLLKRLLEGYFEKNKIDSDKGAPKVEEENYKDTLQTLKTTLEKINRDVARYILLFYSTNKITKGRTDASFKFKTLSTSVAHVEALKNLNALYIELSDNIHEKIIKISRKYDNIDTKYNLVDIKEDLDTLLILNETLNQTYDRKKKDINDYLDIIDPERDKDGGITQPKLMAVELNPIEPIDVGWSNSQGKPPAIQSAGGNPAKYKSTGQVVYIMYKNKKYKRVIYVKDKRNTRYCKINKEYILLSKLKVIQLH